jgi:hypothetical protein
MYAIYPRVRVVRAKNDSTAHHAEFSIVCALRYKGAFDVEEVRLILLALILS